MEDILSVQMLSAITWAGDTMLFEETPPVRDRPFFQAGDWWTTGRIWMLPQGSKRPTELISDDRKAGFRIASVSPGGRKVLLRRTTADGTAVVLVDLKTRRRVTIKPTPQNDLQENSFTWLSDDAFFYAARDTEDGDLINRQLHAGVDALTRAWRATRLGTAPAASVLSSRSNPEWPRPVPGNLMIVDAKTGRATPIADGVLMNVALSSSKRFAAVRQRGEFHATRPIDGSMTPFVESLKVLQLNGHARAGARDVCPTCEVVPNSIVWSGDTLIFFGKPRFRSWREGSYYRYDAHKDVLEKIDIGSRKWAGWEYFTSKVFSEPKPFPLIPLRGGLALLSSTGGSPEKTEWVFLPEDGSPARVISGEMHGFADAPIGYGGDCLVTLVDGDVWRLCSNAQPKNLTPSIGRVTSLYEAHPFKPPTMLAIREAGPRLIVESTDDKMRSIAFLDIAAGTVEHVATLGKFETVQAATPSADAVITLNSDTSGGVVFRVGADQRTALHRVNAYFAEVNWPRIDRVTYRFGDTTLSSCVYRVPGKSNPKTPIIAYLYPDIRSRSDCNTLSTGGGVGDGLRYGTIDTASEVYLATLGYTVVIPATPANLLDSKEESSVNLAKLVEAAVDAVGEQGWGDASRAGLFGVSQGGYTVLKTLTLTNRFRAAIAGNSQADYASHYGELDQVNSIVPRIHGWGWSVWYQSENGIKAPASPWDDPQWYVRSSPYLHVDKITTPLLLVGNDLDGLASPAQYSMMFNALWLQRRNVDFVRYYGEGHWLENPHNVRDFDARVRAWFDGLLRHDRLPPPGNEWPTTRFDQRQ